MFRKCATLLAALVLLTALPSAAGAAGTPPGYAPPPAPQKPLMVVIGDSMSALSSTPRELGGFEYNDYPGSRRQAWWSVLRRETGYRTAVFAEAGSGWNKPGRGCQLTTFATRVQQPHVRAQLARAQVVTVLGGINDSWACSGAPTLEQAMRTTLSTIRQAAPNARIVVSAPYSKDRPQDRPHRVPLINLLKTVAPQYGAQYVSVALVKKQRFDNVHPNKVGARHIAKVIGAAAGMTTIHPTAHTTKRH